MVSTEATPGNHSTAVVHACLPRRPARRAGYCGRDRAPDGGAVPRRPRRVVGRDLLGSKSMTSEVDLSSELAEARRRLDELESLVEISPLAIVVMDADERVAGWNPAAVQLFGYSL